ncbi:MAG TPA: VWA domain-containing protein, partial [Spirochaetes bacterium]|nr:VWA domain-containing protein [Spirochaetota bacterium]
MKVNKLLVLSSIVLISGFIMSIQTTFAKDVVVLPIKSKVRHGKRGVLEKGITQILINQLVLSNIKTLSLKDFQALDKNRLEAIKRASDYIVSGELERYNDYYSLTLILTNREGNHLFRKKHRIKVQNLPFFKLLRSNGKIRIKLNNPQIFSLINPLVKDLIGFIQNSPLKQGQRDKQIEIMFVIGSSASLKDEIHSLKKSIREIVRTIHSLRPDITIRMGVMDSSRMSGGILDKSNGNHSHSFFTENILAVEQYLDRLAKRKGDDNTNIMDGLRHALREGDWSIYKKDPKLLFLLTDRSIPKNVERKATGQLIMIPFQKTFRYRKSISQDGIHQRIVLEAPAEIEKSLRAKLNLMDKRLIHSKAQNYLLDRLDYKNQEALLRKIDEQYHVPYIMTGRVERKRDIFTLTLNLKSQRTHRTVLRIRKQAVGYDALLSMIHPIGNEISEFMARNRVLGKPGNPVNLQFEDIINLAKSKSVKVYTIGCSGLDLQTQKTLTRVSELMDGSYTNPLYYIMAFLSQNQRMNLIYQNQKLYQVKES